MNMINRYLFFLYLHNWKIVWQKWPKHKMHILEMQNSFLCICRKIHRYWRQIWCVVLRLLATTTTAAMIRLPILAPNFFFSYDTCQSCKEDISRTSSKSILCIPYYYYLYMYYSIFFYGSSSLVRLESVSCVLYLLKYPRRRGGGGWHC